MKQTLRSILVGVGFAVLFAGPVVALAQTAPSLGTAASFAVLAGSTVTNTGSSFITGDLGVSPGSAVTGFPPGVVVSGTIHAADAAALSAQSAVTTAYNSLAGQACTQDLTGQDLGGMTLTAGVYCFSTSAGLTGNLTLDAQGNPDAVFVFKIGSTLTTASGSSVIVSSGGSPCNVFWQVGSSATLGSTTSFAGNILAQVSISLNSGAGVTGRTLARTGAVTLISNSVAAAVCVISPPPPPPTCPPITISPATLPSGRQAVAYSQQFTASGGTAPYLFRVTAGALPAGLTLTLGGRLAGTPTVSGFSSFTVRATDANGCFTELPYTLVIAAAPVPPPGCPPIALSPAALPNAAQGVTLTQTITGSGGTAPYVFGVTAGALPAGLTLTAGGILSGRPNNAGSSTFTVRGTDANGCFAELPYTLTVVSAVPTLPQWAAMLLAAGLLGLGWLRLRRRQALL